MSHYTAIQQVSWAWLGAMFVLGGCQPSMPDQALFGSNSYLSEAIDRSIRAEFGAVIDESLCIRPNPGFSMQECTFVRRDDAIPTCTQAEFDDGHCRAIEVREATLERPAVMSILADASEAFCSYAGATTERGMQSSHVIGCAAPAGDGWRLTHRAAPLTICVTVLGDGRDERVVDEFVMRDGGRSTDDDWCRELFDSK